MPRRYKRWLPISGPRTIPAGGCAWWSPLAFLVLAKVATVYVPLVYSRAVDRLSSHGGAMQVLAVPVGLIVAYGLIRLASAGFGELRDAVFASVQQRTVRRVALETFRHMHRLSLRFHLDRQTGGGVACDRTR